jgi:hypothetical protein
MSPVQEKYEAMMQESDSLLTSEGFRRSGQNFRKRLPGGNVRWSICFQKSRSSTADEIKFTFWIHAEWKQRPAYYEDWEPQTTWYGGAGNRIGYFMPRKEDTWWDIDEETSALSLNTQINGILSSCALPFLKQFQSETDIKSYLRGISDSEMRLNYPHAICMLSFDLLENKEGNEIEKSISKVKYLGKINGVNVAVTEADIQRVLRKYGNAKRD